MKKHQTRNSVLDTIADILEGVALVLASLVSPKPRRQRRSRQPRTEFHHYPSRAQHVYIHVDQ